MSKALKAVTAAQMKPGAARREVPDGGCPGLYLVVHTTGAKAWVVRFRSPVERDSHGQRKAKKLTLGPLAIIPLVQARALATAALEQVQRGIDPTQVRRTEKADEKERNALTVDAAMIVFLTRYRGPKKQGLRESTRNLTAHYFGLKPDPDKPGEWVKREPAGGVLQRWSGRPLASVTKGDVTALVEAIDDRGAPVTANRTLTALKTFFKFWQKRGDIDISPAELVDAPAAEQSRDRVLSDDEIRALWRAADVDAYPFGRLVQLLLLTGARRDELREAPWSEFDIEEGGRYWKLPPNRTKNGKEHTVPLSSGAIAILRNMPRIHGRALLFTTTGVSPISGLSKAKRRLDEASGVSKWTLHDLRRTVATGMADKCGVLPHVVEAALNHVSGESKRGVAGIYNRARYTDEIRDALEAWARYVDGIVNDRPALGANVVALR
jgi:integrase